jgi:hypothetical protein
MVNYSGQLMLPGQRTINTGPIVERLYGYESALAASGTILTNNASISYLMDVQHRKGGMIIVTITAQTGTLAMTLQIQDPQTLAWFSLATKTSAASTPAVYLLQYWPGNTAADATPIFNYNMMAPPNSRLRLLLQTSNGGSDTNTYSVSNLQQEWW